VTADPPTRLSRRLGGFDAVAIGLGAMLGAGVFAVWGPAARAAGNGLLVSLVIAAIVATCNALSSAQLAALYPVAGGVYAYGRERLSPGWGWLAGWGFVTGKLASGAAMALTFATYAAPTVARPLAAAAVLAVTAVNQLGVKKTAAVTKVIVAAVVGTLAFVVVSVWAEGRGEVSRLWPLSPPSVLGVLRAAGLLFFAFAGYARITTLGEEVVDPARTIPRAVRASIGITWLLYAAVGATMLAALPELAGSAVPLVDAVPGSRWVRIGAAVASLGVLLSLLAGIGRTVFAMAANGDLPRGLAAVHPARRTPHRAEWLVGLGVASVAAIADVREAIGFSAFAMLVYYAIGNAAAWAVTPTVRAALGLAGCVGLAVLLPWTSVVAGATVLAIGVLVRRATA
jgi:basic amino acid/polyamine antiporter, APA family